jgi:hypothetical protein
MSLGCCLLDHSWREVDAGDAVAHFCQEHGDGAGATPEVEDACGLRRQDVQEYLAPGRADGWIDQSVVRLVIERGGLGIPDRAHVTRHAVNVRFASDTSPFSGGPAGTASRPFRVRPAAGSWRCSAPTLG